MTLSDEKVTRLVQVLFTELVGKNLISLKQEDTKVRREMKRAIVSFLRISEDIDAAVQKKLQSFSRKIVEGSPEWEILYRKFYQEETARRGMASK